MTTPKKNDSVWVNRGTGKGGYVGVVECVAAGKHEPTFRVRCTASSAATATPQMRYTVGVETATWRLFDEPGVVR